MHNEAAAFGRLVVLRLFSQIKRIDTGDDGFP